MTNTKFNISVDDIAEALKNGATPDDIADSLSKALNAALKRNKEDAKRKKQEKIANMQTILDEIALYITTYYKTAENAEIVDLLLETMKDAETWVEAVDDGIEPTLQVLSKLNKFLADDKDNPLIDIEIKDIFNDKNFLNTFYKLGEKGAIPIKELEKAKKPSDDQIIQNFLKKMGL